MWPFRRSKPSADLTERVELLEKQLRNIRVDWDETYEKFARLNQRIAKRVRDAQKLDAEHEEPAEPMHTNALRTANGRRITNPLAAELLRGHTVNGG